MKIFYCFLITLAFNCHAELSVIYNENKPFQIYSGQQPNDKTTEFFDPNVGVGVTNTYTGVALVLGIEYKCDGDTDFIKRRLGKHFNAKSAALEFTSGSPQRYNEWPGSPVNAHLCTLYWTSHAIGTTVSTSYSWGITLSGYGADVGFSISSNYNVPMQTETRDETDIFYMYKDDDCW